MRKIFLFLFAAVLSIGTAMAANLDCAGATATLVEQNLVLQGDADTGEKLTVQLWQGSEGAATGQYPIGDFDIILNNMTWLTAETAGVYTVTGNMFTFEATANDGSTQYSIYMMGSTASSEPVTGEMEATDVSVSISEGVWTAEAYADDGSWSLIVQIEGYEGYSSYDVVALYNDETMLFGTGSIDFNELTGKDVFKADGLYSEDGSVEIYPVLYVSSLSLFTETPNIYPAEESSWSYNYDFAGYSYINLISDDWTWWLDLHIKDFAGDGTYELGYETYSQEVWDDWADNGTDDPGAYVTVTTRLYSKFNDDIPVIGEVKYSVEDGLSNYECELYAVDADGNPGMAINATLMQTAAQEAQEYNIEATATIAEGNYPMEFTCTWNHGTNDHSVKVEVTEVKYGQEVGANFFFDGGIMNDGDQAEGVVIVTKDGNTATVVGVFEGMMGGDIYNVTLSGTVPANILETIVLVDGEDNSTLLAKYNGQKVNVQVENRSLFAEEYNTLVVPFDMPASEIGVAYELTGVVSNSAKELEVNFTKVTTILAGKPYIVIPNKGFYGFGVEGVVIKNVAASTITKSCETAIVAMQGVMNTIAGETTDGLYWIGESGYLYNDEADLLGMRAYFNITTPSGIAPRMRVVTKENEATGVENITTGAAAVKTIENGQLIIIRDNVKYNLQGQIVK